MSNDYPREERDPEFRALREWALASQNEDPKVAGNEHNILAVIRAATPVTSDDATPDAGEARPVDGSGSPGKSYEGASASSDYPGDVSAGVEALREFYGHVNHHPDTYEDAVRLVLAAACPSAGSEHTESPIPRYQRDEDGRRVNDMVPASDVRFIDPAAVQRQREGTPNWPDFHPEVFCHRCGGRNLRSWFVASELWNQVPDLNIVCPQCFTELWEEATGRHVTWELRPDAPSAGTDENARQLIEEYDALLQALNADGHPAGTCDCLGKSIENPNGRRCQLHWWLDSHPSNSTAHGESS